jgi:hypothetical protein
MTIAFIDFFIFMDAFMADFIIIILAILWVRFVV